MFLDIVIAIIMILFIVRGLHRGFVYSFMHTLGWIAAVVLAFLSAKPIGEFLDDGPLGAMIRDIISSKLSDSAGAAAAVEGIPDIISGGIKVGADTASDIFTSLLTSAVLTMLSFILIMIVAGFILRILVKPAVRRSDRDLLNIGDKVLGAVAGSVEGIILVFAFLGMLMVLVNFSGGLSEVIMEWFESSVISRDLYDNNFLLLVTGGFFG